MLWNVKNGAVPIGDTVMRYAAFGHGKEAFILLPGLSDGLATVRGKAALLARPYTRFFDRYTVYMFSRKDAMPESYSIRDMADDQAWAMRALGIERACVMGVSQGGMIAQYLAIRHGELVDRLVLAVSAPYANDTIRACVERWIDLAKGGQYHRLLADMNGKSYTARYIRKYRWLYPFVGAAMKRLKYDRFFVNARAILGFDARDELGKISCPTLVIGGAEDRVVGREAPRELKTRVAGSELFLYEGLGHAAYEEAADFNDRVLGFLEARRRCRAND